MNQDAAYALIGVGVAIGGATIGKAALDDIFDKSKAARRAEQKALRTPPTTLDKVVGSIAIGISATSLLLKLYSWVSTGKAPNAGEIFG